MKKKITNLILTVLIMVIGILSARCSQTPKPQVQTPPATVESNHSLTEESLESQDRPAGNAENKETLQERRTPEEILEQALETYREALEAWDNGEPETALNSLDETYRTILDLDVSEEIPQFQEKNDLRLMIAQRIQEIYASRLNTVINNHKSIPLIENKYVEAEIKSFQTRERKYFLEAYKRSGLYRQNVVEELKKAGLPEELSWIPVIESGYNVRAYSAARALGLWQFISSTGYRFGLKRDRWIDERMDPEKATRAAVKYLSELHSLFGEWTTALASYNCGEFKVQRVIRAQRINYLDNFWDLFVMLPRETARFVPRIMAVIMIVNDPEKYGFELPTPDPPIGYEIVSINNALSLSALDQKLGFEPGTLASLNPELRHKATPDRAYHLKVPKTHSKQALEAIQSIPRWIPPEATYAIHYVRHGETVSGIARRYRTSVSAISRLNHLGRRFMIRPGQRLKVPSRGETQYTPPTPAPTPLKKEKPANAVPYTVQTGDSPFSIAQKFSMNLRELLAINSLGKRSKIYPGQQLWVVPKDN